MDTFTKSFEAHFQPKLLKEIFRDRISESHTVGKDGITPTAFNKVLDTEVALINSRVVNGTYKFTTFKQRLILKSANKPPRCISIATVRDRITLRAITHFLTSIYEDATQPPAHFILDEIMKQIETLTDEYSFVQIDVENFYPSIPHDQLRQTIAKKNSHIPFQNLIMSAVGTPTGDKGQSVLTGVPQGLSISNILSSIYMMEFDRFAASNNTYYRYVDDILIICKASESRDVYENFNLNLQKLGLKCHPLADGKKTKIVPISTGVEYLGYHIRPNKIAVRTSSYRRMIENIMRVITAVKYEKNYKKSLMRLNIKITGCVFNDKRLGWMFFFSMTNDMKQLQRLDNFVLKNFNKYFPKEFSKPKRFLKSFHEIKYNLAHTKYIPRFDDYTQDEKVNLIATMTGTDPLVVDTWDIQDIERTFKKLIRKEIAELEKDVTSVS